VHSRIRTIGLYCLLVAGASIVYSNHFGNSFHFDDFHTITENASVHGLANWKRLLQDPAAFSVLTTHQVFRPLVSLSLAVDWTLAGGPNPLWFHVSTFCWFLVLSGCLFALFSDLLGSVGWGWFAAALFTLHPAAAETVNYIIQRADLYVALGFVAALLLYRRFGGLWYLLPVAAAGLSKPTALIFPVLFAAFLYLYNEFSWRRLASSVALAALIGLWLSMMTGAAFHPGGAPPGLYRASQGFVVWHYFSTFFWPMSLSADTDMVAAASYTEPRVWLGWLFVAGLGAAIAFAARRAPAIAFGLSWFLIALAPTAVTPLAEIVNDHRLFLAFPGLCLAVCAGLQRLPLPRFAPACGVALLAAAGLGAHARNEVWRTEETLWKDVTVKSPRNGRGLMNYALTLMARGETAAALGYFDRAAELNRGYPILEINRAIAKGELGRVAEAEAHFRNAIAWAPAQSNGYFYYGRWLWKQRRANDAAWYLNEAVRLNAQDFAARALLAEVRASMQQWRELGELVEETLRLAPSDPTALRYREVLASSRKAVERVSANTPESFIDLSLAHFRAGQYLECVQAAEKALQLRPGYAEAYNNIAAGYNALHRWDDAIAAGEHAVRLRPDWELARNNLAHSRAQKAAGVR
jgi:tetratricopeptide (TPR) repeat protein